MRRQNRSLVDTNNKISQTNTKEPNQSRTIKIKKGQKMNLSNAVYLPVSASADGGQWTHLVYLPTWQQQQEVIQFTLKLAKSVLDTDPRGWQSIGWKLPQPGTLNLGCELWVKVLVRFQLCEIHRKLRGQAVTSEIKHQEGKWSRGQLLLLHSVCRHMGQNVSPFGLFPVSYSFAHPTLAPVLVFASSLLTACVCVWEKSWWVISVLGVRFQPSASEMIPAHTHIHTIWGRGRYVDGLRPCQAVLFLLLHTTNPLQVANCSILICTFYYHINLWDTFITLS